MKRGREDEEEEESGTDEERAVKRLARHEGIHAKLKAIRLPGAIPSEQGVMGAHSYALVDDTINEVIRKLEIEEFAVIIETHPWYQTPDGIALGHRVHRLMARRDFASPLTGNPYRMFDNFDKLLARELGDDRVGDVALLGMDDALYTMRAMTEWKDGGGRGGDEGEEDERWGRLPYEDKAVEDAKGRQTVLERARANSPSIRRQYERRHAWRNAYELCSAVSAIAVALIQSLNLRACVHVKGLGPFIAAKNPTLGAAWTIMEDDLYNAPRFMGDSFLYKPVYSTRSILWNGRKRQPEPGAFGIIPLNHATAIGFDLRASPAVPPNAISLAVQAAEAATPAAQRRRIYLDELPPDALSFSVSFGQATHLGRFLALLEWADVKAGSVLKRDGVLGLSGLPATMPRPRRALVHAGGTPMWEITVTGLMPTPLPTLDILALDLDGFLDVLVVNKTLKKLPDGHLGRSLPDDKNDDMARARVLTAFLYFAGQSLLVPEDELRYPVRRALFAEYVDECYGWASREVVLAFGLGDHMLQYAPRIFELAGARRPFLFNRFHAPWHRMMQFCLLPYETYMSLPEDAGNDDATRAQPPYVELLSQVFSPAGNNIIQTIVKQAHEGARNDHPPHVRFGAAASLGVPLGNNLSPATKERKRQALTAWQAELQPHGFVEFKPSPAEVAVIRAGGNSEAVAETMNRLVVRWQETRLTSSAITALFFRQMLHARTAKIATDSANAPLVWFADWTEQGNRLFGILTDDSSRVVVKSQPLDHERGLLALTRDTVNAYILRTLSLAYKWVVTPHFATLVTAFSAPAYSSEYEHVVPDAPPRAYALVEDGGRMLSDLPSDLKHDPACRASILFQVCSATEEAYRLFGFLHKDLHWNNIATRDVSKTRYADRPWLYVRAGRKGYYVIEPAFHCNLFVEIIDFDLSTFSSAPPPSALGAFFHDWFKATADFSIEAAPPVLKETFDVIQTEGYSGSPEQRQALFDTWPARLPLIAQHIRFVEQPPPNGVLIGVHPHGTSWIDGDTERHGLEAFQVRFGRGMVDDSATAAPFGLAFDEDDPRAAVVERDKERLRAVRGQLARLGTLNDAAIAALETMTIRITNAGEYLVVNEMTVKDDAENDYAARFGGKLIAYALNCIQQGMALNPGAPQTLEIEQPSLAFFMRVDASGLWGWTSVNNDAPRDATPVELFARWPMIDFDDPEEAEKRRENRANIYLDTILRWLTPLERFRRRRLPPIVLAAPFPAETEVVADETVAAQMRIRGNLDEKNRPLMYRLRPLIDGGAALNALHVSYYVDMARTLWRPILFEEWASGGDIALPSVFPRPWPQLAEGEELWVPRRKPPTTNATGTSVIEPPQYE